MNAYLSASFVLSALKTFMKLRISNLACLDGDGDGDVYVPGV